MSFDKYKEIIIKVAKENDITIDDSGDTFIVHKNRYHAFDYKLVSQANGYTIVYSWEESEDEENPCGRAVYSLRSYSDVVKFCNLLMASSDIAAKRH